MLGGARISVVVYMDVCMFAVLLEVVFYGTSQNRPFQSAAAPQAAAVNIVVVERRITRCFWVYRLQNWLGDAVLPQLSNLLCESLRGLQFAVSLQSLKISPILACSYLRTRRHT